MRIVMNGHRGFSLVPENPSDKAAITKWSKSREVTVCVCTDKETGVKELYVTPWKE